MLIYRAIKIINSYEEASSCLIYNSIQNKLYADNPENVTPMLNMQVCRPRNTALIQLWNSFWIRNRKNLGYSCYSVISLDSH